MNSLFVPNLLKLHSLGGLSPPTKKGPLQQILGTQLPTINIGVSTMSNTAVPLRSESNQEMSDALANVTKKGLVNPKYFAEMFKDLFAQF